MCILTFVVAQQLLLIAQYHTAEATWRVFVQLVHANDIFLGENCTTKHTSSTLEDLTVPALSFFCNFFWVPLPFFPLAIDSGSSWVTLFSCGCSPCTFLLEIHVGEQEDGHHLDSIRWSQAGAFDVKGPQWIGCWYRLQKCLLFICATLHHFSSRPGSVLATAESPKATLAWPSWKQAICLLQGPDDPCLFQCP